MAQRSDVEPEGQDFNVSIRMSDWLGHCGCANGARKTRKAGRADGNSMEPARGQSQGDWAEPAKEAEPGYQTGPVEETEPGNWA